MSEDPLTQQWIDLYRSWPSDGWDGAGQARANHNQLVKMCEAQLAKDNEVNGHGPFEEIPVAWKATKHKCICQTGNCMEGPIKDSRHLQWGPQAIMLDQCSLKDG
jgi:hypothetical protein